MGEIKIIISWSGNSNQLGEQKSCCLNSLWYKVENKINLDQFEKKQSVIKQDKAEKEIIIAVQNINNEDSDRYPSEESK